MQNLLDAKDLHLFLGEFEVEVDDLSVLDLDEGIGGHTGVQGGGHLHTGLGQSGVHTHGCADLYCSATHRKRAMLKASCT